MVETKPGQRSDQRDRKLGDEWTDWKGDTDLRDREISEKASTFLSLASWVLLSFIAFLLLGWFMIKPRIEQVNPWFADFSGWVLVVLIGLFLVLIFIEGIELRKFGKSFFPYAWMERFFLFLLPKTIWLGTKVGISKDRVGNSFIKLHNVLTGSFINTLHAKRLLILLPRCLKKEARTELMKRIDGNDVKVCTAAGGEEAREAIRQYRPSAILAIACERDLMSGIRDVAPAIPVIAVPNKRPEGPCKNTDISLPDLDEALKVLATETKK